MSSVELQRHPRTTLTCGLSSVTRRGMMRGRQGRYHYIGDAIYSAVDAVDGSRHRHRDVPNSGRCCGARESAYLQVSRTPARRMWLHTAVASVREAPIWLASEVRTTAWVRPLDLQQPKSTSAFPVFVGCTFRCGSAGRGRRWSGCVQVSRTPSRRRWLHTAVASVREAPRQEIAGCFEVYGDLTGAAMMAAHV